MDMNIDVNSYKTIDKENNDILHVIYVNDEKDNSIQVIPNNYDNYNDNNIKTMTTATSLFEIMHIITNSSIFCRFILFSVIVNAAIISLVDYSIVDNNGIIIQDGSIRNTIYYKSFHIFTAIYTFEMVIKLLGYGIKIYIFNVWHIIDVIVVICSFISIGNYPIARPIRILKLFEMMKAATWIPEVDVLSKALLNCLKSNVRDVLIVLLFFFLLFAICGTQMFAGPQFHSRCRLTPYPVLNTWVEGLNYADYKCIDGAVFNVAEEHPNWTRKDSPWHIPKTNCFWPIDTNDESFCSMGTTYIGVHRCGKDQYDNNIGSRWCGSDFDALGNPRFNKNAHKNSGTYVEGLSWGYITFDNVGDSMFLLLLTVSTNGWAVLYSYLADTFGGFAGGLFFVIFIILCSFFVLQLIIAIIEDVLEILKKQELKEKELEIIRQERRMELGLTSENENDINKSTILKSIANFINRFDKPDENSLRSYLKRVVLHTRYETVVNILVVINTIILSMDHYPTNTSFANVLDCINFILTIAFSVDGLLQVFGQGIVAYFFDVNNSLDFFIITASIIDLISSPLPVLYGGSKAMGSDGSLSALRGFRLFRVIRLFKWQSLKMLFIKIFSIFISLGGFMAIFLFYLFIMTVVGSQLFANRFRFDDNEYRITEFKSSLWQNAPHRSQSNFDDWNHSFATIFQLLTLDNWYNVLFDCRRARGDESVLFPIAAIFIGTYLVLNLLVATVIENLCSDLVEHAEDMIIDQIDNITSLSSQDEFQIRKNYSSRENLNDMEIKVRSKDISDSPLDDSPHSSPQGRIRKKNKAISFDESDRSKSIITDSDLNDNFVRVNVRDDDKSNAVEINNVIDTNEFSIRNLCNTIVKSRFFETLILLLIILSSITIAMSTPLDDPNSKYSKSLNLIDALCTWIFFAEMILKFIAFGFVGKNVGYFSDSWNYFDFIVVVVSVIDFFGSDNSSLRKLKALRALRAVRPLRIILRIKGLKQVVLGLWASVGQMTMAFGIYIMILFVFAIFLCGFFKGQFRRCSGLVYDEVINPSDDVNDYLKMLQYPQPWKEMTTDQKVLFSPSSETYSYYSTESSSCSGTSSSSWPAQPCCISDEYQSIFYNADSSTLTSKMLCECWGGKWKPYILRLMDNVPMTVFGLFQLTTLEGNTEAMYATVDSNGIDMEPIRDKEIGWVYFWALFIFLSTFIGVNLFLGIIVENYLNSLDGEGISSMMTEEQKEWARTQTALRKLAPIRRIPRPLGSRVRGLIYDFVNSHYFIYFIYMCIILQFLVLAIHHFGEDTILTEFLAYANIILSIIFLAEAVLKMIGFGLKQYFNDFPNVFDFLIVLGTIGGFVYLLVTKETKGLIINIVRLLRVFRLLNLSKNLRSVNNLIAMLMSTLPAVGNIAILLFLALYVYSVLGTALFAKTKLHDLITQELNFRSFGNSMITLITFSTGEGWNDVMYDLTFNAVNCEQDPSYDAKFCGFSSSSSCIPLNGCGDVSSFPYLVSFLLVVCFVFLNLFVGIVISEYKDAKDAMIPHDTLNRFAEKWHEYDPDATCYIESARLITFVSELAEPLGFGKQKYSIRQLNKRIGKLRVYRNGKVHFVDVLAVLSTAYIERKAQWKISDFSEEEIQRVKDKKAKRKSKIKKVLNKLRGKKEELHHVAQKHKYKSLPNGEPITFSHIYYAHMIQRQWREKRSDITTKGGRKRVSQFWETFQDMSNDDMKSPVARSLSDEPIQSIPSIENIYSQPTKKEHVEKVIINYMKSTSPKKESLPELQIGTKEEKEFPTIATGTIEVSKLSAAPKKKESTKNPRLKIDTSPIGLSISPVSENKFGIDDHVTKKLKQSIVSHIDNFQVPDWITSNSQESLPNFPIGNRLHPGTQSPVNVTSGKDHLKLIISTEASMGSPLNSTSPKKSRASSPTSPTFQNTGWH